MYLSLQDIPEALLILDRTTLHKANNLRDYFLANR